MCIVGCILGCNQPATTDSSVATSDQTPEYREVMFRSHLRGSLDADPTVRRGDTIRVTPDDSEPTDRYESILVQLPGQTPYKSSEELYYLRGFAVGRLSAHNSQFS